MSKSISSITLMLCFVSTAYAHDTTHIHPMITKRVSDLIKQEDSDDAYLELHLEHPDIDNRGIFWGKDRDLDKGTPLDKLEYVLNDQLPLYGTETPTQGTTHYNNVIDGVVQEDAPLGKAVDHFFHATTGDELSLNGQFPILSPIPSPQRAMPFFIKAISWYSGYTLESRKRAFFIFGQSLHHVEDMSSPAHVHNDPHLMQFSLGEDSDRDDYESWFLPSQKALNSPIPGAGNKVEAYFGDINNYTTRPVNNPVQDIWGVQSPTSMVQYYYNSTLYSGSLEFPYADIFITDDSSDITDNVATPTANFLKG